MSYRHKHHNDRTVLGALPRPEVFSKKPEGTAPWLVQYQSDGNTRSLATSYDPFRFTVDFYVPWH